MADPRMASAGCFRVSSIMNSFERVTFDNVANCFEVETNGGVYRQEAARPLEDASLSLRREFRQVAYVPADRTITMTTPSGDELVVEAFDGDDQIKRRAGRPVAYLDQNKWVLLARAVHSPQLVPTNELPAARALIRLTLDQQVILPLSSGHLIETGRSDGAWRQQLGPLMVSLSRGWVMRHPLLVRRAELLTMFHSRVGSPVTPAPTVITLDPSQLHAEELAGPPRGTDLPKEFEVVSRTLACVTAIYAVLVEDEVVHSVAGYEAATSWAASHEELAKELRSNSKARHLSRDVTRARFLTDLGLDLPQAAALSGLTAEAFGVWLADDAEKDLAAAPYLGRMRDAIHSRLRNADDSWEANDLIDMLFLPCAAAYADFVVSERKAGDYLLRAQRSRSDGARIITSLADLLDFLGPRTIGLGGAARSVAGGE